MAGFNPEYNPLHVYNLIIDNLKLNEVKNNEKEAYSYGVDYLSK